LLVLSRIPSYKSPLVICHSPMVIYRRKVGKVFFLVFLLPQQIADVPGDVRNSEGT